MVWRLLAKVMSTTAMVVVLIAAIGLLYAHLNQMQLLSVQSGSMSPAIEKGDLVVVNSVPDDLAVGDVITFIRSGNEEVLITHRIVATPDGGKDFVVTQGDANTRDDGLVPVRNIVGRVDHTVPFAGVATDFIKQPAGLLLVVWLPAIVITVSELRRLARYYKSREPYKHPAAESEPRAPERMSTKAKVQRVSNIVLAVIIISSAISLPAWATMLDTATLSGNTIASAKKSSRADHIVIRQLAFRCSYFNTEDENVRPSIVLYNPTRDTFELEGWTLESSEGVITEFDEDDKLRRRRNLRIRPHLVDGLNYAGDRLVLKDDQGREIDAISWGTDTTYLDPALPTPQEGTRYQRRPKYKDRDLAEDFRVRNYRHCSHPCFNYDPWESDQYISVEVYIRSVSEATASD